jgi:hypothetical protein
MRIIREIRQRPVRFGGEGPAGWLPEGAATPLPTPERVVFLDFSIAEDESSSYFLAWIGPDHETSGDTWHLDLEEAVHQAQCWFGIEPEEWQEKE